MNARALTPIQIAGNACARCGKKLRRGDDVRRITANAHQVACVEHAVPSVELGDEITYIGWTFSPNGAVHAHIHQGTVAKLDLRRDRLLVQQAGARELSEVSTISVVSITNGPDLTEDTPPAADEKAAAAEEIARLRAELEIAQAKVDGHQKTITQLRTQVSNLTKQRKELRDRLFDQTKAEVAARARSASANLNGGGR